MENNLVKITQENKDMLNKDIIEAGTESSGLHVTIPTENKGPSPETQLNTTFMKSPQKLTE